MKCISIWYLLVKNEYRAKTERCNHIAPFLSSLRFHKTANTANQVIDSMVAIISLAVKYMMAAMIIHPRAKKNIKIIAPLTYSFSSFNNRLSSRLLTMPGLPVTRRYKPLPIQSTAKRIGIHIEFIIFITSFITIEV